MCVYRPGRPLSSAPLVKKSRLHLPAAGLLPHLPRAHGSQVGKRLSPPCAWCPPLASLFLSLLPDSPPPGNFCLPSSHLPALSSAFTTVTCVGLQHLPLWCVQCPCVCWWLSTRLRRGTSRGQGLSPPCRLRSDGSGVSPSAPPTTVFVQGSDQLNRAPHSGTKVSDTCLWTTVMGVPSHCLQASCPHPE